MKIMSDSSSNRYQNFDCATLEFIARMEHEGYNAVRRLPNGIYAGCLQMIFTGRLVVGLHETGWERCYDYESLLEAIAALALWDGSGDPPGLWIKEKPSQRNGPGGKNVSAR